MTRSWREGERERPVKQSEERKGEVRGSLVNTCTSIHTHTHTLMIGLGYMHGNSVLTISVENRLTHVCAELVRWRKVVAELLHVTALIMSRFLILQLIDVTKNI